ncbi:MAG: xanthine dehydrogenase family protein molybdopterin-binding subunit, partial [Acidimicrobiia bacterium]
MPGSLLGNIVPRAEDPDLLVGRSCYVDDLVLPGVLHLVFVRSTVAHARLVSVDVSGAAAMPGVAAAFTAADLDLKPVQGFGVVNADCARPPLATDRVRFVGEAVAVVAAESRAAAIDAAEAVVVDYEPLAAAVTPEEAVAPDAPLQFPDLGTNVAGGTRDPDAGDPYGGADVVVRARIENQRVAVLPLEGNAIAVVPAGSGPEDEAGDWDLTVYVATQMPHGWHKQAAGLFGIDASRLRVIAPHVGGAFGGKVGVTAEHAVAVGVALRLGRPVKWVEDRSENLVAMPHGRGQLQWIELGLRRDGTFTGMWCRIIGDTGAYAGFGGGLAQWTTRLMAQGPYRIPKIRYDVASVLTNTTPTGAFRGAGRPEATAFLERIVDIAAAEVGLDPLEIRRRNLLAPEDFPYTTLMGATYDSGGYTDALDQAVRLAGYEELRAEQARRREAGERHQLGIGVSTYVEVTAGGGGSEWGSVEVHDDGSATVKAGTSAHGQGHATAFSMLVADRLGIPMAQIRFVQSDTAVVPRGGGTGGSRSLQVGGSAVLGAAEAVLERARRLAADQLEADPGDIVAAD